MIFIYLLTAINHALARVLGEEGQDGHFSVSLMVFLEIFF